jgi:hypothetical protein
MNPGGARRLSAWFRALGFTVALSLLTAWGVGGEGRLLPFAVIGAAAIGLGLLYFLFPRGGDFAFGTATGLAIYTSLFVVLGHAQFPAAADWARPVAFLTPVICFVAAVWWRREELRHVTKRQATRDLDHIGHTGRWLLAACAVGIVCFMLPINRLSPPLQAAALLGAMAAIGVIVAHAVQDVLRLLVDVALIVDEIGGRLTQVAVPATAFLMIYALLVIVFASAYRIADALSLVPLFNSGDGPARLSYSDALHFSVATLSTVGYGDIRPQDDGVRVLASLQVVAGQLLLLFGVAEILRSRRARSLTEAAEEAAEEEGTAPEAGSGEGHDRAAGPQKFRRNQASSPHSSE